MVAIAHNASSAPQLDDLEYGYWTGTGTTSTSSEEEDAIISESTSLICCPADLKTLKRGKSHWVDLCRYTCERTGGCTSSKVPTMEKEDCEDCEKAIKHNEIIQTYLKKLKVVSCGP